MAKLDLDIDKMMEKHREEMEEATDKYAKMFSQKVLDNLKRNGAVGLIWETAFAHDVWWLLLRYLGKTPVTMRSEKHGKDFLHLYAAMQIKYIMHEDGLHLNFDTPQKMQVIEIPQKTLERRDMLFRQFDIGD